MIKVQIIISKLVLVSGYDNRPMKLDLNSYLAQAMYLMTYSIDDLSHLILSKILGVYGEVPLLYTKLYPSSAINNKQ